MNSNVTPIDWAKRPIEKYADFTGRAPRAEFWWFCLLIIVAAIVAMIIESMLGLGKLFLVYGPLTLLLLLGTFVPSLAVQVRRLHDRNQPGWWLLAFYVPYVLMIAFTPALFDPAATPDIGSSAISAVLGLIVLIVAIVLLVFYVLPGTPGDNRYGPNPYGTQGTVTA